MLVIARYNDCVSNESIQPMVSSVSNGAKKHLIQRSTTVTNVTRNNDKRNIYTGQILSILRVLL